MVSRSTPSSSAMRRAAARTRSRDEPDREELPKLLISCSFPLAQVREMIDALHPWFVELAAAQWSLPELRTSHWRDVQAPERLAVLLAEVPGTLAETQLTVSITGSATPFDGC
jgi:hypothetical protein